MKKFLWSLFGVGALLVGAQVAYTATDSQLFTVTVPKRVTITKPVAAVAATLPNSSASLAFPNQAWQVQGNVTNGVGVTFVVQQPFTNTTIGTYKRDAGLSVAVASTSGPATWSVAGTGSARTNYSAAVPVNTATVSASSNKVGQATFNVGVSFLTVDIAQVATGDYVTTVVGTVTEN